MIEIWIRKKQYFNNMGQPIYWVGQNPNSLVPQQGYIPGNIWVNITSDVGSIDQLNFTFTEWRGSNGEEVKGISNIKRTASGSLKIEGDAYRFIKSWVIEDVAAALNSIEVRIMDKNCNVKYDNWVITRGQIEWCEDGVCEFTVSLQQADDVYHCIQKTLIDDNWQGWFQNQPANGKKHPRFSYCNEKKPNGTLIMQWYLGMTGFVTSTIIIFPTIILINGLLLAYNSVAFLINGVSQIFGGSATVLPYAQLINPNNLFDGYAAVMIESAGCGREHPAPLIRDYIFNACEKCGVKVDAVSAPIFFSNTITIEAASGLKSNVKNPYFNACYFYSANKRGIRRFRNINLLNGHLGFNNTDYYIEENAVNKALSDFLDIIVKPYNASWRVRKTGNDYYLYIWRKDWFVDASPLYDFTTTSADRIKILQGVCFEARDIKFPSSVDGLYSSDPIDSCGNEAIRAMNGYAYSFNNTDNNPNFVGILESKSRDLSATRFRLDGHTDDYLYDTLQIVMNGSAFVIAAVPLPTTAIALVKIFREISQMLRDYADHALLLKDENASFGKILIWDGQSYENAKCVRDIAAHTNNVHNKPVPVPDGYFNQLLWEQKHSVDSHVRGENVSLASSPDGNYQVKDYLGVNYTLQPALLVNYPMYFNPGFKDTLWDWFWWIEDPVRTPKLGLDWSLKIELCCDDLTKLGVINDASNLATGTLVKLPTPYYQNGKLTEIIISYNTSDDLGQFIELKGEI